MAELKSSKTVGDVDAFLDSIEDEAKRGDSHAIRRLMTEVTGEEAAMWCASMVGFGSYHYRHEAGREGDWFTVGFSPRKQSLTLSIMDGSGEYDALGERPERHSTGKARLSIRRLSGVNAEVPRELVERSVRHVQSVDQHD